MTDNIKFKKIVVTPLCENCYVMHNEKEAVVFDPGGDYHLIKAYLDEHNLSVKLILLTHGHFDHTGGAVAIKKDYNAEIIIHTGDEEIISQSLSHADGYGIMGYETPTIDKHIVDGDIINFNGTDIKVIHTPGHSKACVSYLIPSKNILISGDTLFYESVGRTDLFGGNSAEIEKSISQKLYTLPDDILVFPGHGPATRIGHEKQNNPFVRI